MASASASVRSLPSRRSWSRLTVTSTWAACSPPMTEIRAEGQDHRNLGPNARPHMP